MEQWRPHTMNPINISISASSDSQKQLNATVNPRLSVLKLLALRDNEDANPNRSPKLKSSLQAISIWRLRFNGKLLSSASRHRTLWWSDNVCKLNDNGRIRTMIVPRHLVLMMQFHCRWTRSVSFRYWFTAVKCGLRYFTHTRGCVWMLSGLIAVSGWHRLGQYYAGRWAFKPPAFSLQQKVIEGGGQRHVSPFEPSTFLCRPSLTCKMTQRIFKNSFRFRLPHLKILNTPLVQIRPESH